VNKGGGERGFGPSSANGGIQLPGPPHIPR
jgi:hypothetical protein